MAKVKTGLAATRERALAVYAILRETYPDAHCSLDYTNALELVIATILAAQCTDARVNLTTPALFARFPTPADYANAPLKEIEGYVKSCGFYRNKAKNIQAMCQKLLDKHGGQVPGTMDELVALDGVGRKTANVVMGECFETGGVVVDTHCGRLARRLGFTKNTDPVKVEKDLMKVWPRDTWRMYSHSFVFHGRAICDARSPKCSVCPVAHLCPFPDTREGKKVAR